MANDVSAGGQKHEFLIASLIHYTAMPQIFFVINHIIYNWQQSTWNKIILAKQIQIQRITLEK